MYVDIYIYVDIFTGHGLSFVKNIGRGGPIGRAKASRPRHGEFDSWSSPTNDL